MKTFENKVFSGASIETGNHNLDSLLSLPGVVNVWPNVAVKLDPVESRRAVEGENEPYSTHNATGVSKLHSQGIYGKGAKVGVVDTGIWYKHPDVSISTFVDSSWPLADTMLARRRFRIRLQSRKRI